MSTTTPETTENATSIDRPGRRKAFWVIAAIVVLAAAGAATAAASPFSSREHTTSGVTDNSYPTSLAAVTRRTLDSQTSVSATLEYAGSYNVINRAQGTITALPAVGQVITRGESLYWVDGSPVVLLYGATPLYRTLSEGLTGADVEELNADLVALGYATSSQLSPTSDYFGGATVTALEDFQYSLGVTETGSLTTAQAVVLPSAARITTINGSLGGSAQAGQSILNATSTARQVTVALDTALQSQVKVGDPVTVTLPDQQTTQGVITSVGTVATAPSQGQGGGSTGGSDPTVTVQIMLIHPAAAGSLDQAPVQVAITNGVVDNALVVPVSALLARPSGGYAVEVVSSSGVHSLMPVTVGLFDDANGVVQISGTGLSAGDEVVVPSS